MLGIINTSSSVLDIYLFLLLYQNMVSGGRQWCRRRLFGVEGYGVVGGGFDFDGVTFVVGDGGVGYIFVGYFYFVT